MYPENLPKNNKEWRNILIILKPNYFFLNQGRRTD